MSLDYHVKDAVKLLEKFRGIRVDVACSGHLRGYINGDVHEYAAKVAKNKVKKLVKRGNGFGVQKPTGYVIEDKKVALRSFESGYEGPLIVHPFSDAYKQTEGELKLHGAKLKFASFTVGNPKNAELARMLQEHYLANIDMNLAGDGAKGFSTPTEITIIPSPDQVPLPYTSVGTYVKSRVEGYKEKLDRMVDFWAGIADVCRKVR